MKGIHAEERYLLIDILSGCIVKSYMSVTIIAGVFWIYVGNWYEVECYIMKNSSKLRWHLLTERFVILSEKRRKSVWQFLQVQQLQL